MSDWPDLVIPPPPTLTPFHPDSLGMPLAGLFITNASGGALASASATWGANVVNYYPFMLYTPAMASSMFCIVGTTANGNVQVGIYDWEKHLIVASSSTAQGASGFLGLDITDTLLLPGRYFMAITLSSATGTLLGRFSFANDENYLPMLTSYNEVTGSFGLPDPANFATSTATTPGIITMGIVFAPDGVV